MAFTTMSSAAKAATVLLLIIAASTVSPVSASTMRVYEGPGCGKKFKDLPCGCSNLTGYKGGYFFNYSGGWVGRFYYGSGCGGRYDAFGRDARRCSPHSYNSVYIPC